MPVGVRRRTLLLSSVALVAVLSVSWMMSIRWGERLGDELSPFSAQDGGVVASRSGSDWSLATLESNAALRFSLDGQATSASARLPAGAEVAVSAAGRPIEEGDLLSFCADGAGPALNAVVVLRVAGAPPQELRFAALPPCA